MVYRTYCEGVTTFLGSSVPLRNEPLRTPASRWLPRKLKVRQLIHSDREVRMAALSGRTSPRIPLDRYPANPRPPLRIARRDAALLCSAGAFPARRDEALRGALGVGGGGRG